MLIVTGAPTGVVVRAERGGRAVLLIPAEPPEAIRALASAVLDQPELSQLEHHLRRIPEPEPT